MLTTIFLVVFFISINLRFWWHRINVREMFDGFFCFKYSVQCFIYYNIFYNMIDPFSGSFDNFKANSTLWHFLDLQQWIWLRYGYSYFSGQFLPGKICGYKTEYDEKSHRGHFLRHLMRVTCEHLKCTSKNVLRLYLIY